MEMQGPRGLLSTLLVGLVLGASFAAAQWVNPALMPWVIGMSVATIAANLKAVIQLLGQYSESMCKLAEIVTGQRNDT